MTKFTLNRQWFAERPYIIAAVIALVLIVWMVSGISTANEKVEIIKSSTESNGTITSNIKAQVQVETLFAKSIVNNVELYGRTEPDRVTTLKAELHGKIVKVLAERGSTVKKGQVIVEIALNDLSAKLTQTQALLKQKEIEYEGALKLNKDGYQGKAKLAQAFAALESAKADIMRLELDIDNTVIKAPFDGVLNTRYVEMGDYVAPGDDVAMIADLDPLVVRAHVTEKQISQLSVGQLAQVKLLNNRQYQGELRYIASIGSDATNTFKIEVVIENKNSQLLAGLSSELSIALEQVQAIKISPALLALDEQGNIGVKSVIDGIVQFTSINIIKSEADGIWLSGLGDKADIITLGQGFVRAGDSVEAIFANNKKDLAEQKSAAHQADTATK
jgi:multidrug efflux system membrane fusion protein